MREVIESASQYVPLTKVCAAVGVPRSTLYRLRKPAVDKPQQPRRSSRALSVEEKTTAREVLNSQGLDEKGEVRQPELSAYEVNATYPLALFLTLT